MSVFRRTVIAPAHRARTRAAHRRRGRFVMPTLASALSATVLLSGGIVALETVGASATTTANPLAGLKNFTVVVEGDAALGLGGGGEIEGSLAAGGDLRFRNYNLNANKDGSAMPVVDGKGTQLLIGGTVQYENGSGKVDLNAGAGRIGETTGLSVSADGRLQRQGANGYVLKQNGQKQSTLAEWTLAGGFASTFGATLFADLRASSDSLAELSSADGVAMVATPPSSSEITVALVKNRTNVWNIGRDAFSGITAVNFKDGVVPSASTPLIINVTGTSGSFSSARFNGAGESVGKYVLWNFAGYQTLTLSGSTEMYGSVLAPDAALQYDRGNPLRGQIVAKSFSITGNGEIHHYPYTPEVPAKKVTPKHFEKQQSCVESTGQVQYELKVLDVEGVQYALQVNGKDWPFTVGQWTTIEAGTAVLTATAKPGYVLTESPWSRTHTFSQGGTKCDPPKQSVTPETPTYTDVCDTSTGQRGDFSLTVPTTTGVIYSLTIDGKPRTVTAGETVSITSGTAVLSATAADGYTLTSSTPWTHSFDPEGADCERVLIEATPKAAVTGDRCDPATGLFGDFTVTVPSTTGIVYTLTVGGAPTAFTAGTPVAVAAGQEVVVTAAAADGYVLKGDAEVLRHRFDAERDGCDRDLTPVTPQTPASDETCTPSTGLWGGFTVTVPATTGVVYTLTVDGAPVAFTAGEATPVAAGTAVVTATAADGYTLTGTLDWSRVFDPAAADCDQTVTPGAVDGTQSCDTSTGLWGGFTVITPSTEGVRYALTVDGAPVAIAADGRTPVTGGTAAVTASALPGYALSEPLAWSRVFDAAAADCDIDATPAASTPSSSCDTTTGLWGGFAVTVPATTGVRYELSQAGSVIPAVAGERTPVAAGEVVVTPSAETGYRLTDATPWRYSFAADAADCDQQVTPGTILPAEVCDPRTGTVGDFAITVPSTVGVRYTATLDGQPLAIGTGSNPVPSAGVVRVTPTAGPGYALSDATVWEHEFSATRVDCEAEPLPVTPAASSAQETCLSTGDWSAFLVTVPSTESIVYTLTVDGVPVAFTAGVPTNVPAGTAVVTATAAPGFALVDPSWRWERVFAADAEGCNPDLPTLSLVDPQAGTASQVCAPTGDWGGFTVLVPTTEHVTYTLTVDGEVVPFTTGVPVSVAAGTAVLTATAAEGYALSDPEWRWSRSFAADAEGCAPVAVDPAVDVLSVSCVTGDPFSRDAEVRFDNSRSAIAVEFGYSGIATGTRTVPAGASDVLTLRVGADGGRLDVAAGERTWPIDFAGIDLCGDPELPTLPLPEDEPSVDEPTEPIPGEVSELPTLALPDTGANVTLWVAGATGIVALGLLLALGAAWRARRS